LRQRNQMLSLVVNAVPHPPLTSKNQRFYVNFTNFRKKLQQYRPFAPFFLLIRIGRM